MPINEACVLFISGPSHMASFSENPTVLSEFRKAAIQRPVTLSRNLNPVRDVSGRLYNSYSVCVCVCVCMCVWGVNICVCVSVCYIHLEH